MDSYFDHIRDDIQFEPNPDDGVDFVSHETPSPEEVAAFWAEVASDEWIPF